VRLPVAGVRHAVDGAAGTVPDLKSAAGYALETTPSTSAQV